MRISRSLVCLMWLAVPGAAAAQTVSLTPSVIELNGKYGQSTTQTLRMTNATGLALTFVLQAQDVVVVGGKRVFVPAGDVVHSIAATAVFVPRTVTIPAGASRAVSLTVTVPPLAGPRAIVALFKGTTRIIKGKSASTVSLGTLLTFTLSTEHSLAASDLSVSPQSETRNAAFEITFTNDGGEPATPRGVAVILNASGAIIGRATFEPLRVLPGERLTFTAGYPGELKDGTYRVVSTFEFAGKALTRTAQLVVK